MKIKSCFGEKQPAEFYQVELDGEVVATIRNITYSERGILSQFIYKSDFQNYTLNRMLYCLGGKNKKGEEGWNFKEEVTLENLDKMANDNPILFYTINTKINEVEKDYKDNVEGILKNLNKLSDSTDITQSLM